jgi:hypothetical protein
MRASVASLLLAAVLLPQTARAQDRNLDKLGLPRSEVARLRDWVDDAETRHYREAAHIGADDVVHGSVVVWQGGATIAGRVAGHVLIIDGDAQLQPGASITGDLIVVGGHVYGTEAAVLAGGVTAYAEGFGPAARAERAWVGRDADRDWSWTDEHWRAGFGDSDFAIRLGENYNRVEGLPVLFGPEIRTGGSAPTRLDAYAIWRTEVGSPFDGDRFGYLARVEQWFDRDGWVRVGGTARSVVQPIERAHVSDVEASLASFVLHDDLRDYYERTGWSAYARFSPARHPFDLTIEYRDEEHATAPVRTPWTLFDREDSWRAQPLAAEGAIRLLGARAELDLRRSEDFSTHGWRFDAEVLRSLEADLTLPVASPDAPPTADPFVESFTVASLDLRRYQRAGRNSTLGLRVVGAGTIAEQPLPPQFQHALGGAGSLPGYAAFDVDCGARSRFVNRVGDDSAQDFFPSYGCDRYAMFQAEYRGGFDFRFGGRDGDDDGWNWDWDLGDPSWIVFFDAARGWAYDRDPNVGRFDTGTLYDAGLGILLGDLGIYGAVPFGDGDRELRLFVRLGPRF